MPGRVGTAETELSPAAEQDLEAGSPNFSIAAVKPAALPPGLYLHVWPAHLGADLPATQVLGHDDGSSCSESGSSSGIGAAAAVQQTWPWVRAWHRLTNAAGAAAAGAARAMPLCWLSRGRLLLSSRTRSLEVLSLGREQSAPYLPSKRPVPARSSSGDDPEASSSKQLAVVKRWQRACQAVMEGREVARCVDLLGNRLAPPDDRLHAAVLLKMRLAACPPRKQQQLAWALLARRRAGRTGCSEHVVNELYITGEKICGFFTPPPMGHHCPYFILLFTAVLVLAYFFMAGQYGQYQALVNPGSSTCLAALQRNGTAPGWGPGAMVGWIAPRQEAWCYGSKNPGKFDAQYLIDWGARWAPHMRKRPQRWLTSSLLHQTFSHLLSNALLLMALGAPVEAKYGTWRVALVGLLSAFGGNLFSAVTEAPCTAVVGASGVVFGMAGLTLADMVLNFETLTRPLLRMLVLLAFLIFFAITVAATPTGTSHMSHVGGFLCGLLPGLVLLPNLHRGRAETVASGVGAAGCLTIFLTLPLFFYMRQLPNVCCGC